MTEFTPKQYVRHAHGGLYQFLFYAKDTDNRNRRLAVYKHCYPFDEEYYARSTERFSERMIPVTEKEAFEIMRSDRKELMDKIHCSKQVEEINKANDNLQQRWTKTV